MCEDTNKVLINIYLQNVFHYFNKFINKFSEYNAINSFYRILFLELLSFKGLENTLIKHFESDISILRDKVCKDEIDISKIQNFILSLLKNNDVKIDESSLLYFIKFISEKNKKENISLASMYISAFLNCNNCFVLDKPVLKLIINNLIMNDEKY